MLSGSQAKVNLSIVPFAENKEFVSNYILPVVLQNCNKGRRNTIREYAENNYSLPENLFLSAANYFENKLELEKGNQPRLG